MHTIFEEERTETVLLIDASNAFNSVNRNVFLHNVTVVCLPSQLMYVTVILYHQDYLSLKDLKSKSCERTTQGDPIAMAVYAIAINTSNVNVT